MYSITQNGKPLHPSKYLIDKKEKTFYTKESNVILDFSNLNGWTFETDDSCVFITGSNCKFITGVNCMFSTKHNCKYQTGDFCTFDTNSDCVFNTGDECTFDVSSDCVFNVGAESVIIRRDIFEVIQPEPNKRIKLNGTDVKGFTFVEEKKKIIIDGKEIEISIESFNELKKHFC